MAKKTNKTKAVKTAAKAVQTIVETVTGTANGGRSARSGLLLGDAPASIGKTLRRLMRGRGVRLSERPDIGKVQVETVDGITYYVDVPLTPDAEGLTRFQAVDRNAEHTAGKEKREEKAEKKAEKAETKARKKVRRSKAGTGAGTI